MIKFTETVPYDNVAGWRTFKFAMRANDIVRVDDTTVSGKTCNLTIHYPGMNETTKQYVDGTYDEVVAKINEASK